MNTYQSPSYGMEYQTVNNQVESKMTKTEQPQLTKKKKKKKKNKRVKKACIACRKSKVACSEGRPCKRCLKRGIPCIDDETNNNNTNNNKNNQIELSNNKVVEKVEDILHDPNGTGKKTAYRRKRSKLENQNAGLHKMHHGAKKLPLPIFSSADFAMEYNDIRKKQGLPSKEMQHDDDIVDVMNHIDSGYLMDPQAMQEAEDSIFNEPLEDMKENDLYTLLASSPLESDQFGFQQNMLTQMNQLKITSIDMSRVKDTKDEILKLIEVNKLQQEQIKQAISILKQQRHLLNIFKKETGMTSLHGSPMVSTAMYNLPPGLWDKYASHHTLGIFVFGREGDFPLVGFNTSVLQILNLQSHELSHTNFKYADLIEKIFHYRPTKEKLKEKQANLQKYHGVAFPIRVTWMNLESVMKVVLRIHDQHLWWICLDFSLLMPPWDLSQSEFHKDAAPKCPNRSAVDAIKYKKSQKMEDD